MLSFCHDNDVPFYAHHLETMSPVMLTTLDPWPPHYKQTMSPFMLIISGNDDVLFYAYQLLISHFMPIRVWKKLLIKFTQNRVFFLEQSVRFEFSLPPKHTMSRFKFISLNWPHFAKNFVNLAFWRLWERRRSVYQPILTYGSYVWLYRKC